MRATHLSYSGACGSCWRVKSSQQPRSLNDNQLRPAFLYRLKLIIQRLAWRAWLSTHKMALRNIPTTDRFFSEDREPVARCLRSPTTR
jgi:hypothetical protein